MKKYVYILLTVLLFSGCLKEGDNSCPAYIRLTFAYDGDLEKFDRMVGNDVHLHIYQDDLLVENKVISYSQISGGNEYVIPNRYSGFVDLVAWAVPVSGNNSLIPDCTAEEKKTEKRLRMNMVSRSNEVESMNELFLGTVSLVEEEMASENVHNVSLSTCICKVSVVIASDAGYYSPEQIETARVDLHGTKSEMDLDFNGVGLDAVVPSILNYDSGKEVLYTGGMGVLPSADGQFLSLTAYRANVAIFRVDTEYRSVPGDEIEIYVDRNLSAIVTVNGWRIFATVTNL